MSAADFTWTNHALARWKQRFAGIDRDMELSSATLVGKKIKKRIKRSCPVSAERWMQGGFKGRYYMMGRSQIVFVIQAPGQIVTAFHLWDR